jgi:1-hydroxy-2-naphthoate dioxygenase
MNDDGFREFDAKLAAGNLYGQWTADKFLQLALDGPRPRGDAYIWKWAEVKGFLLEACEVMPESFTARRSLMYNNPGLERGTTHTLAMGVQMILPGEIAWAHRHSINALRFTIEGNESLFTVVDGEPCPMENHDLVLTPGWTWHDHHNHSGAPACWLDVLDVPLVLALNQAFYEPYGEDRQPLRGEGEGFAARLGAVRPAWEAPPGARRAVRYPWRDVEARLKALQTADGSPYDGVALEYTDPVTGGPTLPTLTCWVQWLKPGQETLPQRRTSSAACFVVRGEGRTVVGEKEIDWAERDGFCIPNWSWHHHVNRSKSDEAILFTVHDAPLLRALGFYREEPVRTAVAMPPAPGDGAVSGK